MYLCIFIFLSRLYLYKHFYSNAVHKFPVYRDNNVLLYCIVLYCIVLYCIVLYCIVLYCIVLYCIVLYCIVLYCIVLYCIVSSHHSCTLSTGLTSSTTFCLNCVFHENVFQPDLIIGDAFSGPQPAPFTTLL